MSQAKIAEPNEHSIPDVVFNTHDLVREAFFSTPIGNSPHADIDLDVTVDNKPLFLKSSDAAM